MEAKLARYEKHLRQYEIDQAASDDEIHELPIKTKINASKHEGKIGYDLLSEAFRWRLSQNDCQNRGYVLDGYPFSYETSNQVFFVQPTAPQKKPPVFDEEGNEVPAEEEPIDEETLAEMMKPKFQKHIYPDSVILMRGDDKSIRQFAKSLSSEQNTKWDRDNLERKLAKWN